MNEAELRTSLNECNVPQHLHDGLVRYMLYGILPGNFLTAVLENDFEGAVFSSSGEQFSTLRALAMFLHWHVPSYTHGSMASVRKYEVRVKTEREYRDPRNDDLAHSDAQVKEMRE